MLGWDNRDTALHLDAVAKELTENLAWPVDEDDADKWRSQWRAAFSLCHQEVITTARDLSMRLAELARAIRDRIQTVLAIETEDGRITQLMKAFQETLMHDLDVDGFADMYAQTITYGLLSARIADPRKKTTDDFASHMRTNPFLRDLMETFLQVGGRRAKPTDEGIDFDELGVSEVVELLDNANIEAVIRDFGDRNPREDPVIHFYELFLKEYDAEKRIKRGVFYTPRPVVSYIVRSVDKLLRKEFGLADGLADTTTWGEMARRHADLKIPQGISPDQDFVQILDPATGTGTFLVETIDVIYGTLVEKWRAQGYRNSDMKSLWNEYVPEHLLPRLHGYELLMAPYAIAHLKISLKLYETGYQFSSEKRAQVYLTNALEPAHDFFGRMEFVIPALAHEAQAVNKVKSEQRFTVVVGNPPYSGHSANKGAWIRNLLRGTASEGRVENYFEVDGSSLNERNPKWLNDDYVKFTRLAHWQIEQTGVGVGGFITNHSYLDNPTFRGMRESLTTSFPMMFLLDLHGNAKKKERMPDGSKDENVFLIQQGVAIGLFVKATQTGLRQCSHTDLWGCTDGKYSWLAGNDVSSTTWNALSPKAPLRVFVPRDETLYEEYEAGWRLTDVFPVNGVGMTTARDHMVIDFEPTPIIERVTKFRESQQTDADLCTELGIPMKKGWNIARARDLIKKEDKLGDLIEPVLYRPFDVRLIFYHDSLVWRTVKKVMRHMLAGENLGLCIGRAGQVIGSSVWDVVYVSTSPSDFNLFRRGGNCLFPLYCYPKYNAPNIGTPREPNLDQEFIKSFGSAVRLKFISDDAGNLNITFGPKDVFHYIYAVFHSSNYRTRYADFLKSDFPRVPLPGDRALFAELIPLGARLVNLHLIETVGTDTQVTFPNIGSNQVDKVRYEPPTCSLPGRVWINRKQYFGSVKPDIWMFTIGGYRPADKWLKDRKGRTLSEDDIKHYGKIITAFAETIRLMKEIDGVIERHGGWPDAFFAY